MNDALPPILGTSGGNGMGPRNATPLLAQRPLVVRAAAGSCLAPSSSLTEPAGLHPQTIMWLPVQMSVWPPVRR